MQEFIDRLGKTAQATAKSAQQTAAEARLRLAIRTLNGKLDEHAQALGHLLFRRHEGETVAEEEMLGLLKEMTDLKAERQTREAELAAVHQPSAPPPAEEPASQETKAAEPPDQPPDQPAEEQPQA